MPTLFADPLLNALLASAGVLFATLAVLLAIRHVVLRRLRSWAERTETRVDDLILDAVRTPSLFWTVALALAAMFRVSPLGEDLLEVLSRGIQVLLVASVTLVAANVAGGLVTAALRRSGSETKVPGLGRVVARGVVLTLGAMVALKLMGVEIAPMLTALGVGGLAVALALQETLSNFFAGLHILLERPYAIGDFIRLEDGKEGHVLDVGWRTTRIRTMQDDVVVVPNSRMAGSTLVNFHMPIRRSRLDIPVLVDFGSDVERVRAVVREEVEGAAAASGGLILLDPPPQALLMRFGDHGLELQVRVFVDDVSREPVVRDAVLGRIVQRFRQEGITIPVPVRRVLLEREP